MADTVLAYLHPNEVSSSFHESLLNLLGHDLITNRYLGPWVKMRCAAGGIPEGRNMCVESMLEESRDIEWLFFIDADMGFQPDVLERLRAVADPVVRPIVGGLCFAQREMMPDDGMSGFQCVARPTIYDWVEHPDGHSRFTGRASYPINHVVECAATGGACLLIHRSILERMKDEYGPHWFDRVRGTDGSLLGEDISFFVRCGSLDIRCHVHTGIRTSHFKHVWLSEVDFWLQQVAPPATEPVDVIVPVLHRPQNVKPLLESLRASTGLATAWFVCEPDDLIEWAEVDKYGGKRLVHPGTFAEKVNYAYTQTSAPWMVLVGDDVVFRPGWLDHAQHIARIHDGDVIGTNDLGNLRVMRGEHATHMMIRRSYIDEVGASWDGPGVVCHEYGHCFVDDEIVAAAKQRGRFQAALGSIIEHNHPYWNKAARDEIYEKGESHLKTDQAEFQRRLHKSLVPA
jgi:hypothetical protein